MRVVVAFGIWFIVGACGNISIKRKYLRYPFSLQAIDTPSGKVRSELECATTCSMKQPCYSFLFIDETKYCYRSTSIQDNFVDVYTREKIVICLARFGYTFDGEMGVCYRAEGKTIVPATVAKEICKSDGGHLFQIFGEKENNFVARILNVTEYEGVNRYFIDGSDAEVDGQWKFFNGESMRWQNWYPTENPVGINQNCLNVKRSRNFKWSDVECTATGGYVCEINV